MNHSPYTSFVSKIKTIEFSQEVLVPKGEKIFKKCYQIQMNAMFFLQKF